MNKRLLLIAICTMLLSIVLSISKTLYEPFLCAKYLLLSYGISIVSYTAARSIHKKENRLLYFIGVITMGVYTILTIDTFLIHAITWFPGILRYPLYSLYGIPYLFFLIPGWMISYHA